MKDNWFLDLDDHTPFNLSLNLNDNSNMLTRIIIGENSTKFHTMEDWSVYFMKPASPIMYGIIDLHDFIMVYLVFIVFFVTFMLSIILKESTISEHSDEFVKFHKVRELYNVKFNHHTTLETIWILIPTIILLNIAIPSFVILYAMNIIPHHDITIKVIGHQWYWTYEYIIENFYLANNGRASAWWSQHLYPMEDHKLFVRYSFDSYMIPSDELKPGQSRLLDTTNPLVIPVAKYASITVTSSDVIHSFAVPSLGIKVDAVPGRLNTVSMYIMEVGHYYGQCSELCGVNHGFMPIEIFCVDMIGFTIYKAALSTKLVVAKDIVVDNALDTMKRQKYVEEQFFNTLLTYKKGDKVVYFKLLPDLEFLKKIKVLHHIYKMEYELERDMEVKKTLYDLKADLTAAEIADIEAFYKSGKSIKEIFDGKLNLANLEKNYWLYEFKKRGYKSLFLTVNQFPKDDVVHLGDILAKDSTNSSLDEDECRLIDIDISYWLNGTASLIGLTAWFVGAVIKQTIKEWFYK